MIFGLALIADAFRLHQQYAFMRDTATSEIQSVAMGNVEINGTVESDETITAPVTGDEAVVVRYKVEEYHHDDDGPDWNTVVKGTDAESFRVNDGTGEVTVDPDGITVDGSPENTSKQIVRSDGRSNKSLNEFIDRHDGFKNDSLVKPSLDRSEKNRYTEEIIQADDDVYLYGKATSPDGSSDIHIEDSDTEMFFISDQPEDELRNERKHALLYRVPPGAILIAIGVAVLLTGFGII